MNSRHNMLSLRTSLNFAYSLMIMSLSALLVSGCIVDSELVTADETSATAHPIEPAEPPRDPQDPRDPDPPRLTPTEPPLNLLSERCDLSMRWAHRGETYFNGFSVANFISNGHVVVTRLFGAELGETDQDGRWSASAIRISDGAPLFKTSLNTEHGAMIHSTNAFSVNLESVCGDDCQERSPRADMELVARAHSGEALWSVHIGEVSQQPVISTNSDGSRVVFGSCSRVSEDHWVTRLQLLRSEDGSTEHTMTVEGECLSSSFSVRSHQILSDRGQHLVMGNRHSDELRIFDLVAKRERRISLSERFMGQDRRLITLKLNHDASRLIAVTSGPGWADQSDDPATATLTEWSFPELTPTEEITELGLLPINRNTYFPLDVSPLAFSPDGQLWAFVNEHGEVSIARVSDNVVIHTLEQTELDIEERGRLLSRGDEPTQIHFSPDGLGVTVQYTGGVSHFACTSQGEQAERASIAVSLRGPAQAQVGQEVIFDASQADPRELQGFEFSVDGVLTNPPSTSPSASWVFQEAGLHEVSVRVLDGVSEGEATMLIEVTE